MTPVRVSIRGSPISSREKEQQELPCGARETILEPLRPGVTVNLGQQEFVLRSCKSWLARFAHIEALSEMALRGDRERNIRAAIEFVAAVQKETTGRRIPRAHAPDSNFA
jgi:hypothetical protein